MHAAGYHDTKQVLSVAYVIPNEMCLALANVNDILLLYQRCEFCYTRHDTKKATNKIVIRHSKWREPRSCMPVRLILFMQMRAALKEHGVGDIN